MNARKNSILLTPELANRIVTVLNEVTGSNVNVMGPEGIILASVNKERIGQVHKAAQQIMAGEVNEVAVTQEMAETLEGVKPGYNGAIDFQGVRIGCIGISGDPEIAKPLQKLAAMIIRDELLKTQNKLNQQGLLLSLSDEIEHIADEIRVLAINGSIQASKLGSRGEPFKVVVGEMSRLVTQITQTLERIRDQAHTT
jgi:sugar diacid utilization regulator